MCKGVSPAYVAPPTLGLAGDSSAGLSQMTGSVTRKDIEEIGKIQQLILAYQFRGHELADLDPLKLSIEIKQHGVRNIPDPSPELDYRTYGFTEADLEREFVIPCEKPIGLLAKKQRWKLGDLLQALKDTYSKHLGVEKACASLERSNWVSEKMEAEVDPAALKKDKLFFFSSLQWTSMFEQFLALKFTTTKRFSASGLDTMMPCLKIIIEKAIEQGAEKIIIGMSHRGRINVLANIIQKPLDQVFAGFHGTTPKIREGDWGISGDVKYHLGAIHNYVHPNGKKITLQLMPNPSHLESIDPVTNGRVRAEQEQLGDSDRTKVVGILVHGDAAFSGQGIVSETFQFEDLLGYKSGGTVHLVLNNQIGFTTIPKDSRSGFYSTEIAKTITCPIFHVNSEDPESIIKASKLASEYQHQFKRDVVVDLIGYRLYGHNEMDQPMFTQPIMYKKVKSMKPLYQKIKEKFVAEGIVKTEEAKKQEDDLINNFSTELEKSKKLEFNWEDWKPKVSFRLPLPFEGLKNTGLTSAQIKEIGEKINTIPPGFAAHPLVKKVYEARLKSIQNGTGIDWATGEALAWGSLLKEGHNIRLAGQDVQRGTFSHRHSYLHSQKEDKHYIPFGAVKKFSEEKFRQEQFNFKQMKLIRN